MPVRKLTPSETQQTDALLELIKGEMSRIAGADSSLMLSVRRRVRTRLAQWEGSTAAALRKLQALKYEEQRGRCLFCGRPLTRAEAYLERLDPSLDYSLDNTQVVHMLCGARKKPDEARLDQSPSDPTEKQGSWLACAPHLGPH